MERSEKFSKEVLSNVEKRNLTFQAVLKAIPYFGEPINHLIYGRLEEIRWKRIEKTLKEMANEINRLNIDPKFNERFANILEVTVPSISRETIEESGYAVCSTKFELTG